MNITLKRNLFLFGIILIAAISRVIPHPINFSPIGALSLFGAAYFTKKSWAFIAPLVATFISDIILNNTLYASMHDGFTFFYANSIFTYIAIALSTLLGFLLLKKVSLSQLALAILSSSVLFFIVSNFGSWIGNAMYTQNAKGLLSCFIAGIPYFSGTLLGTLTYSVVLFGGILLAKKYFSKVTLLPA